MDKLIVFFIIALVANGAFGQTPTSSTTQSPAVRACIASCPVTPEYNPVCGTDNVTYNNPGNLNCARMCGVNVSLLRMSPCPPATPVEPISTTQSPSVRSCIANCPVTSEFNPVCGTDNVTYSNPGRLTCAQMCGVDVALLRNSPCSTTPEPTTTTQSPSVRACIASCPVTSEFNPVCGTDNVTYNNPGRLICAQMCGVNVSLLRTSRCPTPTVVPA